MFLEGEVEPALNYPIRTKVFVKFPTMESPQVFDFEFAAASMAPSPVTDLPARDAAPTTAPGVGRETP
jgi:hypothetical protein